MIFFQIFSAPSAGGESSSDEKCITSALSAVQYFKLYFSAPSAGDESSSNENTNSLRPLR